MDARWNLKDSKYISKERINKYWQYLLRERKCVAHCNNNTLILESDGILRCLMCGKRYYKDFPERPHNSDVCSVCGSFFVSEKEPSRVCKRCSEKPNTYETEGQKTRLKL